MHEGGDLNNDPGHLEEDEVEELLLHERLVLAHKFGIAAARLVRRLAVQVGQVLL